MSKSIPIYTINLPNYTVTEEPNHAIIGRTVDTYLKQRFLGQTIVVRGLSSKEHPEISTEELIKVIEHHGTDRYDPKRAGDRYENIQGKHIDLFAFRRKVTERTKLFQYMSWGFYHGSIAIHGEPVRVDILTIYDASRLKRVAHQYEGRDDVKRDGFVFKDPGDKVAALRAIIHLT